MAHRRSALSV
jgi:hypothetical protein